MAQQQQDPQQQQANPNVNPEVNMPKSAVKPATDKPATQGIPARQAYKSDAGGLDTSEEEANSEGMAGGADDREEDEKSY